MDDGDGLAPVALTVEGPVLHLVLDALLTDALLLKEFEHTGDGVFFIINTVQELGVDHVAVAGVGLFFNVAALDDRDDVNAEFLCKLVVALVVGRNRHDGTGAVTHHDIDGDIDGNLFPVDRVDAGKAVNAHTGLILDELGPLKLRLLGTLSAVGLNVFHVGNSVFVFINERMLRSHDHE